MAQLGHTDPALTLRVYAHKMRRAEGDKEALKALVEGRHWAPLGTSGADDPSEPPREVDPGNDESPTDAGLLEDGRGGFRTCDLSRVKRALSH